MRRKISIAAVVLGSICCLSVTFAADRLTDLRLRLRQNDPAVQVKAASEAGEWGPLAADAVPDLIALLSNSQLAVRHEAVVAIGKIGSAAEAAVPALLKSLQDESLIVKHSALRSLGQIGPAAKSALPQLDKFLKSDDRLLSVPAAAACVAIDSGSSARRAPAVTILIAALSDDRAHLRTDAVQALASAGTDVVPKLAAVLKQGPDGARIAAAETIELIGPDARGAASSLVALGASSNPDLLEAVATALASSASDDDAAEKLLAKLVHHNNPEVRIAAIHALSAFGELATNDVPAVADLLRDPEPTVRQAAAESLAALGPVAKSAVAALDAALADPQGAVTIRVAEALSRIGAPAVPVLLKRLDDPAYGTLALQTLEQMGPAGTSATSRLVELLSKPGPLPKRELCLALCSIAPDVSIAIPALEKAANDPQNEARAAAIYALGRIGDRSALKTISNAVESDNPTVRLAAAWSLVQIDPKNPAYVKLAVPLLIAALDRPEPRIRWQASVTLGQLGAPAAEAIPALQKKLAEDSEPSVRIAAATALAQFGPQASGSVKDLLALLSEPDFSARKAALYALGRIGPNARESVPLLRRDVLQGPPQERALAAWALLQIQPDGKLMDEALPPLIRALSHERPDNVVKILELLGQVGRGRPDVIAAVESQKTSTNPDVRAAATAALAKLR